MKFGRAILKLYFIDPDPFKDCLSQMRSFSILERDKDSLFWLIDILIS